MMNKLEKMKKAGLIGCLNGLEDEICLPKHAVRELIYWARRYCDGRHTYAPSAFNDILLLIMNRYPDIEEGVHVDKTLTKDGAYWPWAQDEMCDARPKEWRVCSKCNDVMIAVPMSDDVTVYCNQCKESHDT
jgi:hypothetical protein